MANNNARLKFISGQYAGSEIELTPFTDIVFGRNPAVSNFVFDNESISRKHCSIQYNPNDRRFTVTDYSSSGTYVNNIKKMQQGNTEYLSAGDTIKLGHSSDVIQLIAPQRFDSGQGVNGYSDMSEEDDDRKTEKMMPSRPQLTGRESAGVMSSSNFSSVDSGSSVSDNNQQIISPNQVNIQQMKKTSGLLGIVALTIASVIFLICCISLIYIMINSDGYFAPMCVVYLSKLGDMIFFAPMLAVAGLVLGIIQQAENRTGDKNVRNICVAAIILSIIALVIFVGMYLAAVLCPEDALRNFAFDQAGDTLDDILNQLFE